MFSVHNSKQKLKYQGMEPYQVEITPQESVRIAMLDGMDIEGYINGIKNVLSNP